MISTFWESVGSKIADRWAAIAAPTLVFWIGAVLAWTSGHGGWRRLTSAGTWIERHGAATQLISVLAALTVIGASGLLIRWAVPGALRLIEGYLPWRVGRIRCMLTRRAAARAARLDEELRELLAHFDAGRATAEQRARFQRLDRLRRDLPSRPERYMPTRVGNILRAAESRPVDKYGLDAVAIWPHLWLLLPVQARADVQESRTAVDNAVAGLLWGLLFTAFTPWAWWALPVGAAVAVFAYAMLIPARARTFAGLVEATIDLYRFDLYQQLRWPVPANPLEEIRIGRLLTKYLVRGMDTPEPEFTVDNA
jgi:hypothetical protein